MDLARHTTSHTILISLAASLLISGCATSSLFNPYPRQAADYRKAIVNDTIATETQELIGKRENADNLLYIQESGRLNQINHDYPASQQDFEFVIRRYEQIDDEAKISAGKLAAQGSSLLTNENAIPYTGAAYERIFAHQFQVFNYLASNDLTGASVEVRRAANEQRRQELAHGKDIAKAEAEAQKNGVSDTQWLNAPELTGMNTMASGVRNSFLNAYIYYTSAVIWEAQHDWNAATVDYKKALEIHPNNSQLVEAIKRVDQAQKHRFGNDKPTTGKLVVLFEEGFVPSKKSFNLHIPSFHYETYFNIAFPYYDSKAWPTTQLLTIKTDSETLGQTQVLVDVSALAAKALSEQATALMVRQVLRAKVKHEMQQQAQQQSDLGGLVATIFNIVSEQADLRSWLTLPNTAQALYHELDTGTQSLQLQSGTKQLTLDVTIEAGHTTILRVIDAGNRFIVEPYIL